MQENKIPKIFISYSWNNKDFALKLAVKLRHDGVDTIIDEWNLNPGQDKYVFMEQCVHNTEISKVLLLLDKKYTEKANMREGGVGNETQIISKRIYDNAFQEKFIPIIIERDENGQPYTPIYLESRIYIDLSNEDIFDDEYEKLLRNIYNKPKNTKPQLGRKPQWLDNNSSDYDKLNSILSKIKKSQNYRQLSYYADAFAEEYTEQLYYFFKIGAIEPEEVYNDFLKMRSIRDVFLKFIEILYLTHSNFSEILCSVFEKIYNNVISINFCKNNTSNLCEECFDIYKIHFWELFIFIIAFLLYHENYKEIGKILSRTFFLRNYYTEKSISPFDYSKFYHFSEIIERGYKPTTENSRLFTLIGETVCKTRESYPIYKGENIAEADIFLFQVYSAFQKNNPLFAYWFPQCYIYANTMESKWKKLQSRNYCEKIFELFEINSIEELKKILGKCSTQEELRYNQSFNRAPNISRFINFKEIGILP